MLRFSNVQINYGKKIIAQNIDLTIENGEFFGIVGLNGQGKTSLIKSILGLRHLQIGEITVDGVTAQDSRARRGIIYLPERFDPPWFLTGAEFVKFCGRLHGVQITTAEIENYAERLALDVSFLNKKVRLYSKGMRQKLGLISVLLAGQDTIILDEPMSGLDPLARSLVREALIDAHKAGRRLVMCSHLLSDVEDLCGRIAVLHAGEVRFIGAPEDFIASEKQKNLDQAFLSLVKKHQVVGEEAKT